MTFRSPRLRRASPGALALLIGIFALAPSTLTAPAAAQPQGNTQKLVDRFVGAWRLVSVEGNSPVRLVRFEKPTGLIMYDRSGWMSVQIAIHGERKLFAKGPYDGTSEEKAEGFDTYLSYYGTYVVDAAAGTVTHHLVDHSYPGLRGHDNVRWFEFVGDKRLVLTPREDGKGGSINRKDATYKLTWERVEARPEEPKK